MLCVPQRMAGMPEIGLGLPEPVGRTVAHVDTIADESGNRKLEYRAVQQA